MQEKLYPVSLAGRDRRRAYYKLEFELYGTHILAMSSRQRHSS